MNVEHSYKKDSLTTAIEKTEDSNHDGASPRAAAAATRPHSMHLQVAVIRVVKKVPQEDVVTVVAMVKCRKFICCNQVLCQQLHSPTIVPT